MRKGIILAGGTGSRLFPITKAISKQLLPIYDKPMIYYPFSVLMLADIKDILIITNEEYINNFKILFDDGKHLGMNISYAVQDKPRGIAEAFIIGEDFIGDDDVCLILGDNIFYSANFTKMLNDANKSNNATIFGYQVKNPIEYGNISFDNGKITDIVEKPTVPLSEYAVVGLYFYPNSVIQKAKGLSPSSRGELEITEINKLFLHENKLNCILMPRGAAWLDTGSPNNLLDASNFVKTIVERQGLQIGCIEEIAYKNEWITRNELMLLATNYCNKDYRDYLLKLID